ncbi:nitroreductase [Desulfosporosinus orientis DSM 765]|uniref:Nitroreductase n=1 Tax=Desulfosporosinus orientis (strain ATCC 19365 / DSM 765 / NCIMB 8382 / VKM B-1628 / Singapore I) TaxID=768706 RepID=G7WGZ1_DESOD|nr:nitroreductase family protein [Desulfosporosinus orientis]AET69005.1 nitroreductase [Desulfosporosinus orientis DSM 765]
MLNMQIFDKPVTELIKQRLSVRTYSEKPLVLELKKALHNSFQDSEAPFGGLVRFSLIEKDSDDLGPDKKLGTYGVIKGASAFLIATAEKSNKDLEDLGYAFEKVILYATSLGLGTCWLGGTFKKSEFAEAAALKDHEILPCISPIGYPSSRRSFVDSAMRLVAGSKNRKDWQELFFRKDFAQPLAKSEAGGFEIPLEMVRLAPSASNKQPWRIVWDGNKVHFYLQHTKGYAKFMAFDLQRVDMGIAMCHFELTAQELGINGSWQICDPGGQKPIDTDYVVSWVKKV